MVIDASKLDSFVQLAITKRSQEPPIVDERHVEAFPP